MKTTTTILFLLLGPMLVVYGQEQSKETFVVVEQTAEFPGGLSKFYDYFRRNLDIPKGVRKKDLPNKIFAEFVVAEDGSVDAKSARIIHVSGAPIGGDLPESLDREVVRVIAASPKWSPGKIRDQPVRQRFVLPITFQ